MKLLVSGEYFIGSHADFGKRVEKFSSFLFLCSLGRTNHNIIFEKFSQMFRKNGVYNSTSVLCTINTGHITNT